MTAPAIQHLLFTQPVLMSCQPALLICWVCRLFSCSPSSEESPGLACRGYSAHTLPQGPYKSAFVSSNGPPNWEPGKAMPIQSHASAPVLLSGRPASSLLGTSSHGSVSTRGSGHCGSVPYCLLLPTPPSCNYHVLAIDTPTSGEQPYALCQPGG